jgi:hypothetical protein
MVYEFLTNTNIYLLTKFPNNKTSNSAMPQQGNHQRTILRRDAAKTAQKGWVPFVTSGTTRCQSRHVVLEWHNAGTCTWYLCRTVRPAPSANEGRKPHLECCFVISFGSSGTERLPAADGRGRSLAQKQMLSFFLLFILIVRLVETNNLLSLT